MSQFSDFIKVDLSDSASILSSPAVYVWAAFIAMTSFFVIRLLIGRYQKLGHVDVPNQRSMHVAATPTGAGIVIIFFLLICSLYLTINLLSIQFLVITIILFWLTFVGWRDDRYNLSIGSRMVTFFILSMLTVLAIGSVDKLDFGDFGVLHLPFPIAALITVLGFMWLLNLYNFMDGMDGLAAMQTIIGAAGFLALFVHQAFFSNSFFDALTYSSSFALLCAVLIASSIGFLVWNWSPAKIFLGDVGSLPIGAFFALCTIISVKELGISIFSCLLMLGLFIFDASYTLVARQLRGENITEAHRSHIYQRLDSVGMSHALIVSVYSGVMLLLAATAILLEWQLINGVVASLIASISVIFVLLWVRFLEHSQSA